MSSNSNSSNNVFNSDINNNNTNTNSNQTSTPNNNGGGGGATNNKKRSFTHSPYAHSSIPGTINNNNNNNNTSSLPSNRASNQNPPPSAFIPMQSPLHVGGGHTHNNMNNQNNIIPSNTCSSSITGIVSVSQVSQLPIGGNSTAVMMATNLLTANQNQQQQYNQKQNQGQENNSNNNKKSSSSSHNSSSYGDDEEDEEEYEEYEEGEEEHVDDGEENQSHHSSSSSNKNKMQKVTSSNNVATKPDDDMTFSIQLNNTDIDLAAAIAANNSNNANNANNNRSRGTSFTTNNSITMNMNNTTTSSNSGRNSKAGGGGGLTPEGIMNTNNKDSTNSPGSLNNNNKPATTSRISPNNTVAAGGQLPTLSPMMNTSNIPLPPAGISLGGVMGGSFAGGHSSNNSEHGGGQQQQQPQSLSPQQGNSSNAANSRARANSGIIQKNPSLSKNFFTSDPSFGALTQDDSVGSIATSLTSVLMPPLVSASPCWRKHHSLLHRFISPYNSLLQVLLTLDNENDGGIIRSIPNTLIAETCKHVFVDGRYFVQHVERCLRFYAGDATWFLTQTLPEKIKTLAVDIAEQLFGPSNVADANVTFVFAGLPAAGPDQITPIDKAQLKLQEEVWKREANVDSDTALIAFAPSPEGAGFPFGQDVIRMIARLLKNEGYDVVYAPFSQHAQMVAMALQTEKENENLEKVNKPTPPPSTPPASIFGALSQVSNSLNNNNNNNTILASFLSAKSPSTLSAQSLQSKSMGNMTSVSQQQPQNVHQNNNNNIYNTSTSPNAPPFSFPPLQEFPFTALCFGPPEILMYTGASHVVIAQDADRSLVVNKADVLKAFFFNPVVTSCNNNANKNNNQQQQQQNQSSSENNNSGSNPLPNDFNASTATANNNNNNTDKNDDDAKSLIASLFTPNYYNPNPGPLVSDAFKHFALQLQNALPRTAEGSICSAGNNNNSNNNLTTGLSISAATPTAENNNVNISIVSGSGNNNNNNNNNNLGATLSDLSLASKQNNNNNNNLLKPSATTIQQQPSGNFLNVTAAAAGGASADGGGISMSLSQATSNSMFFPYNSVSQQPSGQFIPNHNNNQNNNNSNNNITSSASNFFTSLQQQSAQFAPTNVAHLSNLIRMTSAAVGGGNNHNNINNASSANNIFNSSSSSPNEQQQQQNNNNFDATLALFPPGFFKELLPRGVEDTREAREEFLKTYTPPDPSLLTQEELHTAWTDLCLCVSSLPLYWMLRPNMNGSLNKLAERPVLLFMWFRQVVLAKVSWRERKRKQVILSMLLEEDEKEAQENKMNGHHHHKNKQNTKSQQKQQQHQQSSTKKNEEVEFLEKVLKQNGDENSSSSSDISSSSSSSDDDDNDGEKNVENSKKKSSSNQQTCIYSICPLIEVIAKDCLPGLAAAALVKEKSQMQQQNQQQQDHQNRENNSGKPPIPPVPVAQKSSSGKPNKKDNNSGGTTTHFQGGIFGDGVDLQAKRDLLQFCRKEKRKLLKGRSFVQQNLVYAPDVDASELVPLSKVIEFYTTTTTKHSQQQHPSSLSANQENSVSYISSSTTTNNTNSVSSSSQQQQQVNKTKNSTSKSSSSSSEISFQTLPSFVDRLPEDVRPIFGTHFPFAITLALMGGLLSPRILQFATQNILRDPRITADTFLMRKIVNRFVSLEGLSLKLIYERLAKAEPEYRNKYGSQIWLRWYLPTAQPVILAPLSKEVEAFGVLPPHVVIQQLQQQQQQQQNHNVNNNNKNNSNSTASLTATNATTAPIFISHQQIINDVLEQENFITSPFNINNEEDEDTATNTINNDNNSNNQNKTAATASAAINPSTNTKKEISLLAMESLSECTLLVTTNEVQRSPGGKLHSVGAAIIASHVHALDSLGYVREQRNRLHLDAVAEAVLFAASKFPHEQVPLDCLQLIVELLRVNALTPGRIPHVTPLSTDVVSDTVDPISIHRSTPDLAKVLVAMRICSVFPVVCYTSWTPTPDRDALAFLCIVRRLQKALRVLYENAATCVLLDGRLSGSAANDNSNGSNTKTNNSTTNNNKKKSDKGSTSPATSTTPTSGAAGLGAGGKTINFLDAALDAERIDDFIQASEANLPYELPLSSLAPMIIRAIMSSPAGTNNNENDNNNNGTKQNRKASSSGKHSSSTTTTNATTTSGIVIGGVKSMEQLFNMFPQLGNCAVCPKGSRLASEQQLPPGYANNNSNSTTTTTTISNSETSSTVTTTTITNNNNNSAYASDNNYTMMFDTPLQNARAVVEAIFRFFFVTSALVRKIRRIIHALGDVEISPTLTNTINDLARPLADAEELLRDKAKLLLGKDFTRERLLFD